MNARLVVMMTPTEKRAIEQRARALKLTTSELVRRAAPGYGELSALDEAALELLAGELEETVASMRADLRRALDGFDAHQAEMARIRASR